MLAQHAFRIARVGQEPQEQAVGGRIDAQACRRSGAKLARTWRSTSGENEACCSSASANRRMKFTGSLAKTSLSTALMRPFSMRKSEVRRSLRAAAPAEGRQKRVEARQRLQLLHLKRRADDAGQVADFLGDEEIVLHEALDGAQARVAAIAEPLGHQRLQIEGQALLGPAGQEMQVAAHRPEEALATAEAPIFAPA